MGRLIKKAEKEIEKDIKKIEDIFSWKHHNLFFIVAGLIVAYVIITSEDIHLFLRGLGYFGYIGALLAGLFFSSAITIPASVALIIRLSEFLDPYLLALIGGFGAMAMDILLFITIRKGIKETEAILEKHKIHIPKIKSRLLKFFAPIIAGFFIMSPLPDEIGIAIFSKMKINMKFFLLISYSLNTLGILALSLASLAL